VNSGLVKLLRSRVVDLYDGKNDLLRRAADTIEILELEKEELDLRRQNAEDRWERTRQRQKEAENRAETAERRLAGRDADLVRKDAALRKICALDGTEIVTGVDEQRYEDGPFAKIARAALAGSGDEWPVPIVCDVLTLQHSSGFPDHFTRIKRGDRYLTVHMSKIKGRCEYHAAEFDWLLSGAAKPDILAFDDTEPEGLSDYRKSVAPPSPAGGRE
jgi:hypothetical protein